LLVKKEEAAKPKSLLKSLLLEKEEKSFSSHAVKK
jgi:hypothetical protein